MTDQTILLKDVLLIENINNYKIHFGRHNKTEEPLDAWVANRKDWQDWQVYTPNRDEFNRDYIFSMMQYYHDDGNKSWLFGGIFKVGNKKWVDRSAEWDWEGYENEVELTTIGANFIGRLKLHSPYTGRTTRANFENYYDELKVKEILNEPYSGQVFPGYENIDLSFTELVGVIKNQRPDWKAALGKNKGVYLITDTKANKRYVGSAYGEGGVWSRWGDYAYNGHGGNDQLIKLLEDDNELKYCHENFRFTLLEYHSFKTSDQSIIDREQFWKQILLTKEFGYNSK